MHTCRCEFRNRFYEGAHKVHKIASRNGNAQTEEK